VDFIKVGNHFINLNALSSVNRCDDGRYTVYFTNGKYQDFSLEDMNSLLAVLYESAALYQQPTEQ
jgi:hypothetical protein